MSARQSILLVVVLVSFAWTGSAQVTGRVSVDSLGRQVPAPSSTVRITPDARWILFASISDDLVPGDTNVAHDLFVHDRQSGETTRVTATPTQELALGTALYGAVSTDGRYVTFTVQDPHRAQENGIWQTDRDPDGNGTFEGNHTMTRLLTDGTAEDASSNGQWISYRSGSMLRLYDRQTGQSQLIAGGGSRQSRISADGRFVAFYSPSGNLVPGDTNGVPDVFLFDRQSDTRIRVSVATDGSEGDGESNFPAISADGTKIIFTSSATNFGGGFAGIDDVFVHDTTTGTTTNVNVDSAGQFGNGGCLFPEISPDGTHVAFASASTNLDGPDGNGFQQDIFVRDLTTGTTRRVSLSTSGAPADRPSHTCALSANGAIVAFESEATNLFPDDTNDLSDIFVHGPCPPAYWHLYGNGWPGTSGIPAYTLQGTPSPGATITGIIDSGQVGSAPGLLLIGLDSAEIPTSFGGTLLVPLFLTVPLTLAPGPNNLPVTLPANSNWCGRSIYTQVVIADPGASQGFAFSQGLRFLIGQ